MEPRRHQTPVEIFFRMQILLLIRPNRRLFASPAEVVGDDAAASFELFCEARLHRFVEPGQHVERYHSGFGDIRFESIFGAKFNKASDVVGFRVLARLV